MYTWRAGRRGVASTFARAVYTGAPLYTWRAGRRGVASAFARAVYTGSSSQADARPGTLGEGPGKLAA